MTFVRSVDIPHTIPAAMEVTGFSEEEAYFILRFAGRLGYSKAIAILGGNVFYRARKWLFWIGGWERSKLSQWDHGSPSWDLRSRGRWKSPTPISILGHFATFYGRWFRVRFFGGSLVVSFPNHNGGWGVYFSPDGTPQHPQAKHFIDQRGDRNHG